MFKKIIVVFFCLTIVSCFDYQELVWFDSDLSGYVEFDYRVPLYPEDDRSLIAYLPATKHTILKKHATLVKHKQIRFGKIQIEMQSTGLPSLADENTERSDEAEIFKRFARVKYRIYFKTPLVLEQILLGNVTIRWQGRRYLQVKRSFPSTGGLQEKSGRLTQGIHKLIRDMLQDKNMFFIVTFSDSHLIKSSQGRVSDEARLVYRLPLEKSLNDSKSINWRYSLRQK